jgi:hypothetical protein
MKTAMQEVIEAYHSLPLFIDFNEWIVNNEKRLLEKEKEQMLQFANWCRIEDKLNKNQIWTTQQLFDKYYNETYQSK